MEQSRIADKDTFIMYVMGKRKGEKLMRWIDWENEAKVFIRAFYRSILELCGERKPREELTVVARCEARSGWEFLIKIVAGKSWSGGVGKSCWGQGRVLDSMGDRKVLQGEGRSIPAPNPFTAHLLHLRYVLSLSPHLTPPSLLLRDRKFFINTSWYSST